MHVTKYRQNFLLLDFAIVKQIYKTLKHYVSEAGSPSFFRQEAPNLVDLLDPAILSHLPEDRSRAGLRNLLLQCFIYLFHDGKVQKKKILSVFGHMHTLCKSVSLGAFFST